MTATEHYSFGDRQHVGLQMLPCIAPRLRDELTLRHDFLRALHPNGGYRDLRAFRADKSVPARDVRNLPTNDFDGVDRFATRHCKTLDVYVGVATRRTEEGRSAKDCLALHTVFADLDFKNTPEAEGRLRLAAFPLEPSAVVASGGGLQIYWFLREPLDLQGEAAFATALLRGLSTALGADLSAAEVARILRLPGTLNYKYSPPRPVVIEALSEHRRYTVSDIVAVVPMTADEPSPNTTETLPELIAEGDRNNTLFRIGCKLRQLGWSEGEIAKSLAVLNRERCHPPLGTREVEAIAHSCAKSESTIPTGGALILQPSDPMPSARAFVERSYLVDGLLALRHQAGVFYAFQPDVAAYHDRDEPAVRADLYRFLESAQRWTEDKSKKLTPFQPTKAKVENVLDALRALCNLAKSMTAPRWLQDDPGLNPLDILACKNGLLHIPTRRLLPATPAFFTFNGLDFAFDPHAPEPTRWLSFLKELWPDDDESIGTLQEWIGYLLTPDTRFQKIGMVVGPKRSGKGTIGRVVRRLLGERNVCGPTLANMSEQHGLAVLIGKTAAIIADARITGRTDTGVITERLLSISGEDPLSVPRKYLPDWDGKLLVRFLLLTNELPRIEDASGALSSRFLLLALNQTFYGREDHGLFDRFLPELPGILNWALVGRDRLYARSHFVQPPSSAELITQFENLGSPIVAFLRDRCEVKPGCSVAQSDLFEAWSVWCVANGRDKPGTVQSFGRNLRAAVPWLRESRPRGDENARVRLYEGVGLLEVAGLEHVKRSDLPF